MEVYKAIAEVMAAFSKEGISKSRTNTQGSTYKFRGIDDVLNALSGHLSKANLVIIPRVLSRDCVERQTSRGNAIFYTSVDVEFDLVSAVDGSKHTARVQGEAMDVSDKSTNKAMSSAYKYMAFQTFCIPTEGDNDADANTHEVQPQQLAKSQEAREAYAYLQKDLRAIGNVDDLRRWWDDGDVKELRRKIPEDWQRELRQEWEKTGKAMSKANAKPVGDVVADIQKQFPGSKVVGDKFVDNFINGTSFDDNRTELDGE